MSRAKEIARQTRIAASPADVWRAWTDPHGLAAWFVERASGRAEPGAAMTWHWDAFGFEARVRVLEAKAPERLVLEMENAPGGARLLEIEIRGEEGGTVLRIVESGFHDDDRAAEDAASGWQLALGVLRIALEDHPGLARREVLVLEPAPADVVPIELFETREGLDRWLCDGDGAVAGAGPFDGECVTVSAREALWTWPARSGALELKSFGPPGRHMVGVRLSLWGAGPDATAQVRLALGDAVGRLCARMAGGL